jgi:ABC-type lipoprotein export system ATPase subunit
MVMAIFKELAKSNMAVAIATHDLSIAERSDRIIHLQDGRIIAQ